MNLPRVPLPVVGWSLAVALVLLPLLGVMQGWFAAGHWPIRSLQVEAPYRHVDAEAIRATVRPLVRDGFFATDLAAVRNALDALPWVASAEARKRWPDTLVIQVRERVPVAHWNADALIDRRGRAFRAPGAAQVADLPHFSGPDERRAEVVAFYQRITRQLANVHLRVRGLHLDDRGDWRLDLADGAHVVLGREHADQRLRRFLAVYPQLARTHKQPFVYADLRYTNGFAVRWMATNAPATAAGQGATRT